MSSVLDLAERDAAPFVEENETIYALSSGAPPAGIAVVRLSGARVPAVLARLCGAVPAPRVASVRALRDPRSAELIDKGLVLFFPAPASFTGEDVAELHVHGGRAVVKAVLDALQAFGGLRLAEPGEFTRRAFLSGRLDLTEAEGLADLVAAETEAQRKLALRQAEGSIGTQNEAWRTRLIRARGLIEAELDFSDEEGVAGVWTAEGRHELQALSAEFRATLTDLDRGQRIRDGAEIVILGAVNAGKSSLINAIAQRDVAIVSEEAGTTRDLIEIAVDLGGYRARLVDTAGLRDAEGMVEREGVRRARNRAAAADLVLWLWDREEHAAPETEAGTEVWRVATKADLMDPRAAARAKTLSDHMISAVTGAGLAELVRALTVFLDKRLNVEEPALVTRARHATALAEAAALVDGALATGEAEVVAEQLRRATDAIGRVTGRVDVDEVLDVVFREFCIGK